MAVTSAEVAHAAGVSQATVSYVLNDTPGQTISAKTRDKVLKAAHDLGYRPNAAARSLRTGRGEVVLFPLPGPPGHVLAQVIDAVSAACAARDLTLVTDVTSYGNAEEQLDAWVRVRPAAVLDLLITHDDPVLPALERAGIAVLSAARDDDPGWTTTGDAFALGERRTQLEYLIERGHTRVALTVPPRLPVDRRVERRYLAEMRRIASASGCDLSVERVPLDAVHVRDTVDRWMRTALPDAICASADDHAIAFVAALVARGVNVPGDVAVIGVDDVPAAAYMTPSVTTIRADFSELAEAIATVAADGTVDARLPLAGHHIVVRESA